MAVDKPVIGVDCDGVLLSWRKGFGQHARNVLGLDLTDEDFRQGDCMVYPTFQAAGVHKADIDALLQSYFRDGPAILEDAAIPRTWDWLKQWANPVVVTNRPPGCSTQAKLAELGIEAEVVNNVGAKAQWRLLVDDWTEHCNSNTASGGQSILYRQAWSGQSYGGLEVSSWSELAVAVEQMLSKEKAAAMPNGPSSFKPTPPRATQDYQAWMRKKYAGAGIGLSVADVEGWL